MHYLGQIPDLPLPHSSEPRLRTRRRPLAQLVLCQGCCCGQTARGLPAVAERRVRDQLADAAAIPDNTWREGQAMPLHDWTDERGWDSVHPLWLTYLLEWLRPRLPEG